jgi:hypothetical protein
MRVHPPCHIKLLRQAWDAKKAPICSEKQDPCGPLSNGKPEIVVTF